MNGKYIRCIAKNSSKIVNTTRVAKVSTGVVRVLLPCQIICLDSLQAIVLQDKITVNLVQSFPADACMVVAALYNKDGKVISVQMEKPAYSMSFDFARDKFSYWKVYVLDNNYIPLTIQSLFDNPDREDIHFGHLLFL